MREFESEAPAVEENLMLDRIVCSCKQISFRCALKVVKVAELLVTEDREFQTAGAVILKALDWKLILVAG